MQYTKLFLASSIREFEQERIALGNFIRSLNDIYIKRGLYFELFLCEDISQAVYRERKQEEYNELIRESQYFYVLFGEKLGEYTNEEFTVALEKFRSTGAPKICTFFHVLPEGKSPEESAQAFMKRLDKELGHYWTQYQHIDSVKLLMLMEMARDADPNSKVTFQDGKAWVNNQPVLSLENVPLYSKNETVQRAISELNRLNAEFQQASQQSETDPDNEELKLRRRRLNQQCLEISKELHRLEEDMKLI